MSIQELKQGDKVLGYELEYRLGAGGYGEVWSARDASGLQKAVKFVFGGVGDRRAERELKSLERVRMARHPFLLSIERIEEVANQLVIVTELADGTLKDVFRTHREAGLPGIPRDELLRYVDDAADALDFMLDTHKLQHLDIKPENLLVLGGRIKVADFGLVKRVGEQSISMMGGLTPSYAAPEVFDDRPGTRSDQYSLAIVFQHMLTGKLPFVGKTAAQLAKQHIMSRPRLDGLSSLDQAVIAQALSKEPGRRFESCKAMVEALKSGLPRIGAASAGEKILPALAPSEAGANQRISPLDDAVHSTPRYDSATEDTLPTLVRPGQPLLGSHTSREVEHLPPLTLSSVEPRIRPTLYVGLGGAGGQVLHKLRRKWADKFGPLAESPALQMLAIDADPLALSQLTSTADAAAFPPDDVVHTPLQRPEAYRKRSHKMLNWLSRRWLYNIPRSLQTEGIRPLGRLALVDNAETVFARMRNALETLAQPDSKRRTEKATGRKMSDGSPRVVLVLAAGGGFGGGMYLDLLYAIKVLLAGVGANEQSVLSFLLYSRDRSRATRELAQANCFALLEELGHFFQEQGYPGDSSCGIPTYRGRPCGPDDLYFCHFGEELSAEAYDDSLESVADYLYLDAATVAGAVFDATRRETARRFPKDAELHVRTLGLKRLGASPLRASEAFADSCALSLLLSWIGECPSEFPGEFRRVAGEARELAEQATMQARKDAETLMADADWTADAAVQRAQDVAESALEGKVPSYVEQLIRHVVPKNHEDSSQVAAQCLAAIDRCFQPPDDKEKGPSEHYAVSVIKPLKESARAWMQRRRGQLEERLAQLINSPGVRMQGGVICRRFIDEQVERREQETSTRHQAAQLEVRESRRAIEEASQGSSSKRSARAQGPGSAGFQKLLENYFQARLESAAMQLQSAALSAVRSTLKDMSDRLTDMRREVRQMLQDFSPGPDWEFSQVEQERLDLDEATRLEMFRFLADGLPQLTMRLDEEINRRFCEERGGLFKIVTTGVEDRAELPEAVRAAAQSLVYETLSKCDAGNPLQTREGRSESMEEQLRHVLRQAEPSALAWGGAKRLFLFAQADDTVEPIKQLLVNELKEQSTTYCAVERETVVCFEGEGIRLANAAAGVIQERSDIADAARRLHSRGDVDWQKLERSRSEPSPQEMVEAQ